MTKELDRLLRYEKFLKLANVVLLNSRNAEPSGRHLEEMIRNRMDKEFPRPSPQRQQILAEIKEKNLRFVKRKIKQHSDGELFVQVQENVREKDVHVFHKFRDPNLDLVELLVIGDALKRSGMHSATVYVPYIPYQRQDKKDEGRVPISSKLFFEVVASAFGPRLRRILTFDFHARQAQGHFDGPVDELSAVPEFAAYYREVLKINHEEKIVPGERTDHDDQHVLVLSPDAGGASRARYLAKLLKVPYDVFDKNRIAHGVAEQKFKPLDVEGKKVILIDDMIDTAGSLVGEYENYKIGPVQYLQGLGAEVYICATHALLSKKNDICAEERLQRAKVPVLVTDSLPEKHPGYYRQHRDWLKVLSLDYTLAKAFYCNQVGESISEFLRNREEKLQGKKLDFILHDTEEGVVDVDEQ